MQQLEIVPDNKVAATVFRTAANVSRTAPASARDGSFEPSVITPISVVIWRIAIDMRGQLAGRQMAADIFDTDEDVSMSRASAIAAFASRQWAARGVPWIGAVLIGVIVVMAATDIVRGYRIAVEETGRELETQSRIIAEQTARSVQAVDVVLRYISEQFKKGALSRLNEEELHNYLKEQAIGLVQAEGLAMHNADGSPRAISWVYPAARHDRQRRRPAGISNGA